MLANVIARLGSSPATLIRRVAPGLLLIGAFLGSAPSAHAGYWTVLFNGTATSSTGTYTIVNNVITNAGHAPTYVAISAGNPGFGYVTVSPLNAGTGDYSMTVQATFEWLPSAPGDNSLPTYPIEVLEADTVVTDVTDTAYTTGSNALTMIGTDGFLATSPTGTQVLEPASFLNFSNGSQVPIENAYQQVGSEGAQAVIISEPAGTTSFKLPIRTLDLGTSADRGAHGSSGGDMSYNVSQSDCDGGGWSGGGSDVTVSIGAATVTPNTTPGTYTTVYAPITLKYISGAVPGSITLTPVWAPLGNISPPNIADTPIFPNAGGSVTVPYQTGGPYNNNYSTPEVGGPTIAQLEAGVDYTVASPISPSSLGITGPIGTTASATLQLTVPWWAPVSTVPIEVTATYTYNGQTITRTGLTTLTIN